MDQPTAERIAVALEAIAAELKELREHPAFVPTGMVVVKDTDPRAKIAIAGQSMMPPRQT